MVYYILDPLKILISPFLAAGTFIFRCSKIRVLLIFNLFYNLNSSSLLATFIITSYRVKEKLDEATAKFDADQKYLQKCYQEYEKHLKIHDKAELEGYERTDITIAVSSNP